MDIVEEIRKDRDAGARRLETEYKAGLMTLAVRLCRDPADAEELVNHTFAEVLSGIDGYLEQSAFFTWMCRILVRCHAKEERRKSREYEVCDSVAVESAADDDSGENLLREVDAGLLRDAVEKLPDEIRSAVVLHYFMGVSAREAARILSIPSGTMLWRLHYARMLLAAKLGAAAKKPGGKALLLALALCGLTALGAAVAFVGDAAFRRVGRDAQAQEQQADDSKNAAAPSDPSGSPDPSDPSGSSGSTGLTGMTGLTEDHLSTFDVRLSTFDVGLSTFDFGLSTSYPSTQKQTMNATTTTRAAALCVAAIAAQAASPAAASGTVYDAGKALRQNCESGAYANPFTDANGGVWSYHTASTVAPFTGLADFPAHSKMESDTMDGWICQSDGNPAHPLLLVNATGEAVSSYCSSGNQLDADEMMFHPSANGYAVLRFTVPQDGWYSAFASFRDVDQGSPNDLSGVDVHVTLGSDSAGDTDLATTHVTLEDDASWNAASKRTRRFDYQMPVRYLTQGMRIQFAVGPNVPGTSGHYSDGTGVKVLVVKENEGRFYDAGAAFKANVAGGWGNPYGTAAHGTWHALLSNLGTSIAETDFTSWAPQNFENSFDHDLTAQLSLGTPEPNTVCGFNRPAGGPPYVTANVSGIVSGNTSPGELRVLPAGNAGQCTVVRFRPPEAGRYSGSVVVRDIGDIEHDYDDGAEIFLVVADQVVTSAVVRAEAHEVLTASLTFGSTLLAAGEPVDIVVSPRSTSNSNDETALSVIFRREDGDVFDANKAFYAHHEAGNTSLPFADALGGGAQWSVGSMTGSWLPESFAQFAGFLTRSDDVPAQLFWWEHAYDSNGTLPRIAMTRNAVASVGKDIYLTPYARLAIAPNEFCAHPASPGQATSCTAVRAIVPSNGIYRVRGRARDLDNRDQHTDGVRFTFAVDGCIPATRRISIDYPLPSGSSPEASLEGNRLWLKAGEVVDAVVDPEGGNASDSTGLGICYECEGDGTASVVNVDFTGTGSGSLSANTARGREGYGDWLTWNALHPGSSSSATVEDCYEADGTTRRNVVVTLSRTSGAAIAAGSAASGTTLLDSFVASSGTDDSYTFTISKLKANEPYTFYFYSAKGRDFGNAAFTVGGTTKGVEGLWLLGATPMLTPFDVVSDANGEISGTFAAADGNGGAFNGLTLVGELPPYKSPAFTVIVR